MRVTDVYMFLLYLSTCHMTDYAFKKTQVTYVNITQVTDVNITQVIDVNNSSVLSRRLIMLKQLMKLNCTSIPSLSLSHHTNTHTKHTHTHTHTKHTHTHTPSLLTATIYHSLIRTQDFLKPGCQKRKKKNSIP